MKYSTRPKTQETGHHKSIGHHISTSRSITAHSRMRMCTHHSGNSTSLHSSCAASTDYHRTACYSDCKSTATIGASIIVSTAYFLCSCGWPTAWDFQTDDFQPTFSCTFTTGGESAQRFWIIQSLRSFCISTDGHTTPSKKHTVQHLHLPTVQKKLFEWMCEC